jgi:acyl carrier protein
MPAFHVQGYAGKVRNDFSGEDPLPSRLKHFIVDTLRLHDIKADKITDDEPLVGGSIGLDSLDALELVMCLEEEFGIRIHSRDESRAALASIASLADFIRTQHAPGSPAIRQALLPLEIPRLMLASPLPI